MAAVIFQSCSYILQKELYSTSVCLSEILLTIDIVRVRRRILIYRYIRIYTFHAVDFSALFCRVPSYLRSCRQYGHADVYAHPHALRHCVVLERRGGAAGQCADLAAHRGDAHRTHVECCEFGREVSFILNVSSCLKQRIWDNVKRLYIRVYTYQCSSSPQLRTCTVFFIALQCLLWGPVLRGLLCADSESPNRPRSGRRSRR